MKRIISILLSLILATMSCVCVSASDGVDKDKLLEDFTAYLEDELDFTYNPELPWESKILIEKYYKDADIIYFRGMYGMQANMEFAIQLGDWFFSHTVITYPSNLGLYVQKDGEIYTLEDAYNNGVITDLSPTLNFVSNSIKIYPLGDSNGDCKININDATTIQKYVAGIETTLIHEAMREVTLDTDKSGNINIRDATHLQKQLAGLND